MVKLRKNTEGQHEAVFAISPSVATLRPSVSRKFGKTASFSHSKLSISSTIYHDQVASKLCTVDFLIVCGDTHVLTVATK